MIRVPDTDGIRLLKSLPKYVKKKKAIPALPPIGESGSPWTR